ncbi:Severe Depolymerization of Actin [Malassezia cuniculi]|uniref:Protein SDA1 n=1 Tax=Malassezia cuniculi TaxID=948313 RepID=A0AAF0EYW8_9BASI|nr:Severe Depolymerization of Actin [Malassezia cuniculi]
MSRQPERPSAIVRENGLIYRSKARGLLNTSNLPALQNLLKRDPSAYTEEFIAQWNHYESLRRIYASEIGQQMEGAGGVPRVRKDQQNEFEQLVSFCAQLAPSYPEITAPLPGHLKELLLTHHASLSPSVRKTCFRALTLLHNRNVITSEDLLRTLFPLLALTSSSELRQLVLHTIIEDIKNANHGSKNPRLNRMVQGLLFGMVERGMPGEGEPVVLRRADTEVKGRSEARWAVRIAAEMWQRRIWNDARTVALLALACTHPHPKVQASAVRFFLGDLHAAESGAVDSEDEEEHQDVGRLQHQRRVGRKTKSTERRIRAAEAQARRRRKEGAAAALDKEDQDTSNMAALHLLHDPQSFAERLFDNLSRGDKHHSLEIKVRLMQLISRVIGTHRLCVLPLYSYMARYLAPHQLHITLILVSLAQSVHDQTPSDVLTPTLRKIAYAFVHPGVGAEVVAAGINTIREICRRQPWCMEEDLLEDLVAYRRSKDKGVSAAARGLMQLYREVNPAMLRRSERGKSGSMAIAEGKTLPQYGVDRRSVHGIQGIELLEKHLAEQGSDADEEAWKDWEVDSDDDEDSDSSGGWIDVSSDDDGASHFTVAQSDDEDDNKTKDDSDDDDKAEPDTRPMSERVREARRKRRMERKKANKGSDDDDDDSDDSDSGSESDDDGDDKDKDGAEKAEQAPSEPVDEFSQLATTRILTPADFAKLNELRLARAEEAAKTGGRAGAAARRELTALQLAKKRASGAPELVEESDILGPRKKPKADHEERLRSIDRGREDREKYGSRKGKKNKAVASSSTNRQKAKGKNFQMVSHSFGVRSKKNASLREKSKRLRKHITQAKKRLK